MKWRTTARFDTKQLSYLSAVSVVCLGAFTLLALIVANGNGPYGLEDPVFRWAGAPSRTSAWANLSELLATPAICIVLVVCGVIGIVRRRFFRVVVYAAIAATAFLIGEHVAKPLVHRSYYEELTFPSGSVTAVSAVTLAMWLALSPVLGKPARWIGLAIGCAWTLLTAFAVVGALWHTPLDALGSMLLSIGIIAGGVAIYERLTSPQIRPTASNA